MIVVSEDIIDAAVEKLTGMDYGLVRNDSNGITNPDGSTLAYMNEAGARRAVMMVLDAIGGALADTFLDYQPELWLAHNGGESGGAIFFSEIEALRYAVAHCMSVKQIAPGDLI